MNPWGESQGEKEQAMHSMQAHGQQVLCQRKGLALMNPAKCPEHSQNSPAGMETAPSKPKPSFGLGQNRADRLRLQSTCQLCLVPQLLPQGRCFSFPSSRTFSGTVQTTWNGEHWMSIQSLNRTQQLSQGTAWPGQWCSGESRALASLGSSPLPPPERSCGPATRERATRPE